MLANCLAALDSLGPGSLPVLAGALFLAGLAGGALHCTGMCGPFVLAQVAARDGAGAGGPVLRRLAGAALLPYQAGRAAGYTALGAVMGGAGGLIVWASGLKPIAAGLLLLAALALAAQGLARLRPGWAAHWPAAPALPGARLAGGLLARPVGWRGFALGVVLSGLPCGLLWGALAAAAASGSALAGAIGMAAFVLGTMPALVALAGLGGFFARRAGPLLQPIAGVLLLANGALLAALAWRSLA
jgi:uncharacterized protein